KAFMAGESYRMSNKPVDAEKWYGEAVRLEYGPMAKFNYGLMLQRNEKYRDAITMFTEYSKDEPFNKNLALEQIKACRQSIDWMRVKNTMTLINLDINTNASEYSPMLYKDGGLVFTSDRYDA